MSLEAVQNGDDDFIVVIIGDEGGNEQEEVNMKEQVIKQEVLDEETDEMGIEEFLETAEKHGELIDINNLKTDIDSTENTENEDLDDDNDNDFVPDCDDENSEEEDVENEPTHVKKTKLRRYMPGEVFRSKMRRPEEQKSYVKEIQQQFPELKDDKELLIDSLSRIMLDVKRPAPPKDYFLMNGDKFECVICNALTETIPASERHYQEKHGPRYLICYACGVDFRSTTNLYKHEKQCKAPDAVTVLKARARTLGRKGRGRPFLLPPEAISKIKKTQSSQQQFPCTMCAAVYRSRQSLQAHMFAHTGTRPYRCRLCPAAYTSSVGLSKHSNKHKNIQYICDHCSRPCKTKSSLIVHLDTHRPVPKFSCPECGKRYSQKLALTLHVDRDHRHLPPPHGCQVCPQRFPRMSLLKTHMLKKHGMNIITRKMFYKALPNLTEAQLSQAKVVMKSDLVEQFTSKEVKLQVGPRDLSAETFEQNEHPSTGGPGLSDIEDTLEQDENPSTEEPDLSKELKQYMRNLKHSGIEPGTKFIVIQDGEAICVDGTNINHYRHNIISEVENDLNNLVQNEDATLEYEEVDCKTNIQLIENVSENTEVNETEVAENEVIVEENENIIQEYEVTVGSEANYRVEVEVIDTDQVISETDNVVAIKNCDDVQFSLSPKSKKGNLREAYKKIMKRK